MFNIKILKPKQQLLYKNIYLQFNSMEHYISNIYIYDNFDFFQNSNYNIKGYINNNSNIYNNIFSIESPKIKTEYLNKNNDFILNFNGKHKTIINKRNFINSNQTFLKYNLFQKQLHKIMKRKYSNNFDTNSLFYLEDIPKSNKELENYMKRNTININHIMNNYSNFLNSGDNFNFEIFSIALFLNKFSDLSEKKKKSINNQLLDCLRENNYNAINNNSFDQEKYLKLLENLHMSKLNDIDKEMIQNKYLELIEKNKISLDNKKKIFNFLYFYDISGNKLQKIKKELFNEIKNNYDKYNLDELYFYNSCLVFHNSKDLTSFLEPLFKRLDFIIDIDQRKKYFSLEQKILNYLPIPKIISISKNSKNKKNIINNNTDNYNNFNQENNKSLIPANNLENIDIYENSLEKIEKFLFNIAKLEEINIEYLIPILSNTCHYLELKSEIFELFAGKFYQNLAALTYDNYIELLFLILQVSKNEKSISQIRRKLTVQLYNSLLNLKTEPRVFIDIDKFYIYLNVARNNLNVAFEKFNNDSKIKENNRKNYDQFKKLIKISLDLFPFSVREKEYSSELLEELLISLNRILNNK